MNPSQQAVDIAFEDFIKELPTDYQEMAYEFKAFCRQTRKVKSAFDLLCLVMQYCQLDLSLRSCAGQFTLAHGYISDMGVKKDWKLVRPGLKPC